jgi:Replication-relaxation
MTFSKPGTNHLVIQPRDRALLKELSTMRVIDHAQAKIVGGFGSPDGANKRLRKLVNAGLLRRYFVGSGPGRRALYSLSRRGAVCADVPLRGPRRPSGAILAHDYFVEHQRAINALYCVLKFGLLPERVTFRRWIAFAEPITPELRLIPDGYVELVAPSGSFAAFLEVDLGHEPLRVWREKVLKYLQLATSGKHRQLFGIERFHVLVVAPTARRLDSIRSAVSKETGKLFRFATLRDAETRCFGAIWQKALDDQRESLITQ